jgi:hypothetical protein
VAPAPVSVLDVLHPVGPLSAAVYWRRRLLVLGLVLAVLIGGGWLLVAALSGPSDQGARTAGAAPLRHAATPSLEQVVPSLAAVQAPTSGPGPAGTPRAAPSTTPSGPPATVPSTSPAAVTPAAPAPVAGGPCSDAMIELEVRPSAPAVAVGSRPTLDLVVTNASPVSCVRALDKGLQEIVLLDAAGRRVWGSNDCFPESSSDPRTLAPGEAAVFPIVWSGLTSEPGCDAPRVTPAPGAYLLRGRLDTALSPDTPLTLT